jgi:hypothetical protein
VLPQAWDCRNELFVGADRRFDVAAIRRGPGILNRVTEIARLGEHALKKRVKVSGETGSALGECRDPER